MNYAENVLGTIGNTPLVKLNKVANGIPGLILAKVETGNPGNSVKDRMALKMIEDAEAAGLLKPGGTIIEGTSGNTGMGLAIAAIIKGYKCIFTTTDKQSREKVDVLRAVGAEVIVCPTNVEAEDPRSYYSVSSRLVAETPNSWKANQYDNPSNAQAHYESTGPEIWKQTEGKITHFVVGVGTGGTISGVGKYLKEKNPDVKIIGIDTYGSVFKKYHETGEFDEKEIYPYITEGIGEDILPENVDFSLIDHFEKVTDKDAAIFTRKIALDDGIFVGNSAGSAVAGMHQIKHLFDENSVVVVLFHDHGSRYVGKMFNDEWMRERGFLRDEKPTASDMLDTTSSLISIDGEEPVVKAADLMQKNQISQLPVTSGEQIVGVITESAIFSAIVEDPDVRQQAVKLIMSDPLPVMDSDADLEEIANRLSNGTSAVLVDMKGKFGILTKQDIIAQLA